MPLETLLSKKNSNVKNSGSLKDLLMKIKSLHEKDELIFDNITNVDDFKLANGQNGAVFKTKTNKPYIFKIASKSDYTIEPKHFDTIVSKKYENVVKIHSIIKIDSKLYSFLREPAEYLVVMEKLEPMTLNVSYTIFNDMTEIIETVILFFEWFIDDLVAIPKMERLQFILNIPKIKKENPQLLLRLEALILHNPEMHKMFADVMNGVFELYNSLSGYIYFDIHDGNVMYDPKSKQYKLIDII